MNKRRGPLPPPGGEEKEVAGLGDERREKEMGTGCGEWIRGEEEKKEEKEKERRKKGKEKKRIRAI